MIFLKNYQNNNFTIQHIINIFYKYIKIKTSPSTITCIKLDSKCLYSVEIRVNYYFGPSFSTGPIFGAVLYTSRFCFTTNRHQNMFLSLCVGSISNEQHFILKAVFWGVVDGYTAKCLRIWPIQKKL